MKYTRYSAAIISVGLIASAPAQTNTFPSSGNVGIGTTNPVLLNGSVDRLVSIEGPNYAGLAIRSTNAGGRQYLWFTDTAGLFNFYDATSNAVRLSLDSSGRLGIGTTSPTNSLDVRGSGGRFDGAFVENTTNGGVHLGRITTPRILFANGNAAQNWQIDNDNGAFRWFLPGVVHMNLSTTELTLPNKKIVAGVGGPSSAIVNAGVNNGSFSTAFHGYVVSNSGVGAILDVSNGVNNAGNDILLLRRQTNGGIAPAVGLAANIAFTLDAGSAASHSPQTAARISSILTAVNGASNSSALAFSTANLGSVSEKMRISNAGYLGIGTTNPTNMLTVSGAVSGQPLIAIADTVAGGYTQIRYSGTGRVYQTGVGNGSEANFGVANKYFLFDSNANAMRMVVDSAGNFGIGTTNPSHKLAVNGSIKAREVIVEITGWSDYVFEEDYSLAPLSEVEAHIREKKHLPGVPSAAEVEQGGVNLGDMQAKLLAKVEELTLHLIAQEKRLNGQAERIAALEKENAALRMP